MTPIVIGKDAFDFLFPAKGSVEHKAATIEFRLQLRYLKSHTWTADVEVECTLQKRSDGHSYDLRNVRIRNYDVVPDHCKGGEKTHGDRAPQAGPTLGTLLMDFLMVWLFRFYNYQSSVSLAANPANRALVRQFETFGFVKKTGSSSEEIQPMILPSLSAYRTHATRLKGVVTGRSGEHWTVRVIKLDKDLSSHRLVPVHHTVWASCPHPLALGESVYVLRDSKESWSVKEYM